MIVTFIAFLTIKDVDSHLDIVSKRSKEHLKGSGCINFGMILQFTSEVISKKMQEIVRSIR